MDIILPDDVISLMRKQIERTKKTNKENGFGLCARENTIESTHIIEPTPVIEAPTPGPVEIVIPSNCKPGSRYIGSYHTHPGPSTASTIDLIAACGHVISCIGGIEDNKIMCYIRKDNVDIKKCAGEFERLIPTAKSLLARDEETDKERKLLSTERERLAKLKRNREVDMKIRHLDKRMTDSNLKLRKYKKDVSEYYQKISILQNKYFDIAEIKNGQ